MSLRATAMPTVPSPSSPTPTDSIAGTVYWGSDDVASPGQQHGCGAVLAAELLEDVAHVRLHGVLAEEQPHRYLGVVLAVGHEPEHVALASRDRRHLLRCRAHQRRVEQRFAVGDCPDRAGKLLASGVLEQVSEGSRLQRREDVVLVA